MIFFLYSYYSFTLNEKENAYPATKRISVNRLKGTMKKVQMHYSTGLVECS